MTTLDLPAVVPAGLDDETSSSQARDVLTSLGGGLLSLVAVVFVASFVTFALGALSNNDPAATILGQDNATPAAVQRLHHALGLDRPLLVQYWHWVTNALHGDLGRSYFTQIPVAHSISQRLPVDLSIALMATLFAAIGGGVLGTVAGLRRGGWIDRAVTAVCSVVLTLPAFVVGIILVVIFSMKIHLFPGNGYVGPTTSISTWLKHAVLPALALSAAIGAGVARQLRTSLVTVMEQNYIVGATVRGLPRRRIIIRHALRNAAGPALTILGVGFPQLLSTAVAAEAVFSLPGLGQLVIQSASARDVPVVQGVLIVTSVFIISVNLLVNAALRGLQPAEGR
jgi:peptide/nickel transport system permease protein